MTRFVAPNMHWAVLLVSLILLSTVRCAVWMPIPINFVALESPSLSSWTDFTSPDIELILVGDTGTEQLLYILTLRTSK